MVVSKNGVPWSEFQKDIMGDDFTRIHIIYKGITYAVEIDYRGPVYRGDPANRPEITYEEYMANSVFEVWEYLDWTTPRKEYKTAKEFLAAPIWDNKKLKDVFEEVEVDDC